MLILQTLRKYWPILISVVITLALSWQLWKPKPPVQETYKPEVKQDDGSIILEKKPDAKAKPTATIPKGSVIERVVKFKVQAKTPISDVNTQVEVTEKVAVKAMSKAPIESAKTEAALACFCPPVDVEMVLIRNSDQTRSVILKSDNGEILNAVDIPVELAKPIQEQPKWAVGAVIDPFKQTYGAFIDRDLGFMRLGAQLNQRKQGDIPNEVWLKAGIRF